MSYFLGVAKCVKMKFSACFGILYLLKNWVKGFTEMSYPNCKAALRESNHWLKTHRAFWNCVMPVPPLWLLYHRLSSHAPCYTAYWAHSPARLGTPLLQQHCLLVSPFYNTAFSPRMYEPRDQNAGKCPCLLVCFCFCFCFFFLVLLYFGTMGTSVPFVLSELSVVRMKLRCLTCSRLSMSRAFSHFVKIKTFFSVQFNRSVVFILAVLSHC